MNPPTRLHRVAWPLILFWLAVCPLAAWGQKSSDQKEVLVSTSSAPVLSGKKVLGRVRRYTRLPLMKTQRDWHQVEFNDGETTRKGWIHNKYVKLKRRRTPLPELGREDELQMADFTMEQGIQHMKQKLYLIAQTHFLQAVEKREKWLGRRHLDTAEAYHHLAEAFLAQKMHEDARLYFGDAVLIYQEKKGPDDPLTVRVKKALAAVSRKLSDAAGAKNRSQRPPAARTKQFVVVTANTAPIQSGNNVLARVRQGASLLLLKTQGDWLQVQFNDGQETRTGWIRRQHVRLEKESAPIRSRQAKSEFREQDKKSLTAADLALKLGKDHLRKKSYVGATASFKQALEYREKVLGKKHLQTAEVLHYLGEVKLGEKKHKDAQYYFARTLTIRLPKLGKEHLDCAASLHAMGRALKGLGKLDDALMHFNYAFAARGDKLGRHLDTAASLEEIIAIYDRQDKFKEYRSALKQLLLIYQETKGAEHPFTARVMNDLGVISRKLGDAVGAKNYYLQALAIRRKHFGDQHRYVARSHSNLAPVLSFLGEYAEALRHAQEAVTICQHLAKKDPRETLLALHNLGYVQSDIGEHEAALGSFREAYALSLKLQGEKHPETLTSLNSIGYELRKLGDFAAAKQPLENSLALRQEVLGEQHPSTIEAIIGMAAWHRGSGDFEQARRLDQQAMELTEKTLGKQHPMYSTCLNNLGAELAALEDDEGALRMLKEAVELRRKFLGPDHRLTATSLNNLAVQLVDMQRDDEAKRCYEQSLRIQRKVLGKNHPDTAYTLLNYCNLLSFGGESAEATRLRKEIVTTLKSTLGPQHPRTILALNNLGYGLARSGDMTEAAKHWDQGRRAARGHIIRVLPALTEREQLSFLMSTDRTFLHSSLSLALTTLPDEKTHQPLAELTARWVLNGKAVTQEALAQQALLNRLGGNQVGAAYLQQLQSLRSQRSALAGKTVPPNNRQQHQDRLKALDEQLAQLQRKLESMNLIHAKPVDWIETSQVQARLPKNAVLVEFMRLKVYRFGDAKPGPAHQYVAWIIPAHGQGAVKSVDLGDAEVIDDLIKQARTAIQSAPQKMKETNRAASEQQLNAVLKKLTAHTLAPLLRHVGSAKQLILSPDGALWLTAWSALPLDDGRYAIEQYEISYVVSGRDLVRQVQATSPQPPIVLADPDFDANTTDQPSNQPASQRESNKKKTVAPPDGLRAAIFFGTLPAFPKLKASAAEAKAIAPSLQEYAGAAPRVFLGAEARESVFKNVRGPRVAALSTHGFFLKDQQLEDQHTSARRSAFAEQTPTALSADDKPLENPLLRCGLTLAGCNRRGELPPGAEDGVLTGLEIVGVDLRGTELVVLSACETGVGEIHSGEGVAGLRQAFQLAGAQAVVASLWSVPDLETARLMKDFFGHLAKGKTRSQALRAAQLDRIASQRERFDAAHPFYWAAFTLTGSPAAADISRKPAPPKTVKPKVPPTTGQIVAAVAKLMPARHVSKRAFDDAAAERIRDAFLQTLDSRKLYFTQADIDQLSRNIGQFNEELTKGNLRQVKDIVGVYQQRTAERPKLVDELLKTPIDFSRDENFPLDAAGLAYARSDEELRERWRRQIKYLLLHYQTEGSSLEEARQRVQKVYRGHAVRWRNPTEAALRQDFLTAMMRAYDPHSQYTAPANRRKAQNDRTKQIMGIGVALKMVDGLLTVQRVLPGGPAHRDGRLKAGDRILAMGQQESEMIDLQEKSLADCIALIRGDRGKPVRLQVLSPGKSESREVRVIRDAVATVNILGAVLSEEQLPGPQNRKEKVGYIHLPDFYLDGAAMNAGKKDYRSATRDLRRVLEELQQQQVDIVLLDLRGHTGGHLTEAVNSSALFVGDGPVMQMKSATGKAQYYYSRGAKPIWKGPLVVLTDRRTAGGAEYFAAAVQDYGRGLVIGDDRTYGMGTAARITDIARALNPDDKNPPRMGAATITDTRIYRISGESTLREGVRPDVVLPSPTAAQKIGEIHLPNPLEPEQIKPQEYTRWSESITAELRENLSRQSELRRSDSLYFLDLDHQVRRAASEEAREVSLNQRKFKESRLPQPRPENAAPIPGIPEKKNDDYLHEVLAITLDYLVTMKK